MESTDIRAAIVAEARSWIDTPWQHQQRTKGKGVDCAGLLAGTVRNVGVSTFDLRDYARFPDGTLLEIARREMIEIERFLMQPGDAVAMKFDRGPSHFGIVTPYPYGINQLGMVHADNTRGFVCEHRMTDAWRQRIVAAFRFPGVPA